MDSSKNYYKQYVEALNDLYDKNPDAAISRIKLSLYRLGVITKNRIDDKQFDLIGIIVISILIFLMAFINFSALYLFGFVFFISGLMVTMFMPKAPPIFLFSHGLLGLGIMIFSDVSNIFENPIMSDKPTYITIYLGISFILLLIGFISTIVHGYSKKISEIRHIKIYLLLFFLIGLLMIRVFPYIVSYLV